MSHDDDHRPRERGAYTPPTDDDLPFNRGGFDARRGPPAKAPPVTLIVSAGVLLVLIIAVVLFYRSGLRSSNDAPPAIGTPVPQIRVEPTEDAQPVNPESGVGLYDEAEDTATAPQFTAPPETPQPRPLPRPVDAAPVTPPVTRPAPAPAPAPTRPAATTPPPTAANGAGGSAAVQIGAFSSTAIADREYAAMAARFPQFARNATKRVQEVTASNGSTVYRTTFTGLSAEDARSFCSAIKAGGGDCLVR
ncbi:SPOR domain-containing protein [Brevundimonas subvibrioides]|uniref:Sporulation domain protein n=1 Tax=Brevundimonas subvibrioides (strain ATCC 15264 / DSM 4735 / LMG 14903 / NBRC 16000 / CB 81) TaxID=633149 RepID=D9QNQ9_BRESC|nr:SPOR domain-containing protein [Brevundimonas subvibrioides]ADL02294.1 Sporulation domain protein [Brevundimonas subvibrioides ATCC 15264]